MLNCDTFTTCNGVAVITNVIKAYPKDAAIKASKKSRRFRTSEIALPLPFVRSGFGKSKPTNAGIANKTTITAVK